MCTSGKKQNSNSKGTLVVIVVFVVSCLWMAMEETAHFPILLFTISKPVSQVTIHQIQLYFYSIIQMLIKSRFHTRKNKTLFKTNRHKCFKSSPSVIDTGLLPWSPRWSCRWWSPPCPTCCWRARTAPPPGPAAESKIETVKQPQRCRFRLLPVSFLFSVVVVVCLRWTAGASVGASVDS